MVPISVPVHRPVAPGPVVPDGHVAGSWLVVVTVHVGLVAGVLSGHVACVVVDLSHCRLPALNVNPSVHAGFSHF
jgi:hypothetical protein